MTKEARSGPEEIGFLADLIEINQEIAAILHLDPLLRKIAEVTARFIPYQVFAILLVDARSQDLYYRFSIGHPAEILQMRIPIGQGIVGTAAREKRPVVVDDVSTDSRYIKVLAGTRSELAVPLISKDRILGVLDIESPEVAYFSENHVRMLHMLGSQIAIAIENANRYEREQRNNEFLELLHEISLEVASTLEVDTLIERIAKAVKSTIDYDILSILLLDEATGTLKRRRVFRHNTPPRAEFDVAMGEGLIGTAALENRPVRVGDVNLDGRYINVHGETASELAVPLAFKGRMVGVLDLESRKRNHFTEYDERLLMTLATRITSALVNAELYERVTENERRFSRELDIAREVQRQLLPDAPTGIGPLRIAVSFTPVTHLGGDLYDFIRYDDGRFAVTVGDVSGKSTPAALYGALVSGVIRTRATRKYPPAEMLGLVNRSLRQRQIEALYIALVYAVYDPDRREISLANAGLPYPIHVRGDACELMDLSGIPLGLFSDSRHQEKTIEMAPGDLIVFYTDGVVERQNADSEEFGFRRLAGVVGQHKHEEPAAVIRAIKSAVDAYSNAPAEDDQTIVVLKMTDETG